jgi:hypothetical protein
MTYTLVQFARGLMFAVEKNYMEYYFHWSSIAGSRVQWNVDWIESGPLRACCRLGYVEFARRLLSDPTIDVTAYENEGKKEICC